MFSWGIVLLYLSQIGSGNLLTSFNPHLRGLKKLHHYTAKFIFESTGVTHLSAVQHTDTHEAVQRQEAVE